MFELYDFRFSHYSEKARWALDFKGVPYTPRHLLPGFHLQTTRKLAPRSSVPILKADAAVIQGSTEIIDFLERTFPERSLTPADPQDANSAVQWEKYLDAEIGVHSACRIHPLRPQACRDVAASWEFGEASPQCDKARLAHGLRVLMPADWLDVVGAQHDSPAK